MTETSAEYCNSRGYEVGTRLIGDEGHGPTVIEITAIGEECVLAKTISHNGVLETQLRESSWVFWCREWSVISEPVPNPPSPAQLAEAQKQIANAFLEAQLQILHILGHEELNYIKTAVTMPEGGTYLLSLLHTEGPKTNVREMFERRKKIMEKST